MEKDLFQEMPKASDGAAGSQENFAAPTVAAEAEADLSLPEQKLPDGDAAAPRTAAAQSASLELQERFLRLAADFANYKRRNEAERAEIADWARRDFAAALLPILDDFALMMEYDTQHPERLADGAKLIRQKMMELLAKHGLGKIEALNQPYDYERHEAILSQPVQDPALDHVVLSVVQEGYQFRGKVLRPSKVIVGQYREKEKTVTNAALLGNGESEKNPMEPN